MTRLRSTTTLAAVVLPFAAFVASVPLLWNHLVSPLDLAILAVAYVLNVASVTVGFHRLLTHRSFATHRPIEYALATLGSMAVQGPVITWVSDHRKHHAHTDAERRSALRVFFVHHVAWSTNSICHFFGRRRFDTTDRSTNVFWLALPSLGEAWHHNHHAFPRSAMHGLRWWEIDVSGLLIRGMQHVGLAWNVVHIDHERQAAKALRHDARAPLDRARRGRANPLLYRTTRALMLLVFAVGFRLERTGRRHVPSGGPLILAANHRSVLDPIIVGLMLRRPVYYMAKQELFRKRWQAWFVTALGAFPVRRGAADRDAIDVAHHILERGDCLVIFPEGRCVPCGPLGRPRRGVGRLALATGATVMPIAITGTETHSGRRLPRRRIRARVGPPLAFEPAGAPITPDAARLATERVWAAIAAEWEALRGSAARVQPLPATSEAAT